MARGTRDRILDTALSQFVARGVEAVTVTDLEEGAGLKPGNGSFYRHFRSKADVLAAVVDREVDRAALRRETRHADGLVDEYTQALDSLDALRPLVAMLVRDGARLPHVGRIRAALAEGGLRLDAAQLQSQMDAGDVPARDAVGVAAVVQMALIGRHLSEQFFGASGDVDRARFVAALADLVGR